MSRKKIFISHIKEEAELAMCLKKALNKGLSGFADIFLTSDPDCLPAGTKWYELIVSELRNADIVLTLLSQHSIQRPWIHYETGGGDIRGINVIPICHSGLNVDTIPPPYNFLQAVNATDPIAYKNLLKTFEKVLVCNPSNIDFSEFIESVRAHSKFTQVRKKFLNDRGTTEDSGLAYHEIEVFKALAGKCNGPWGGCEYYPIIHDLKNTFDDLEINLAFRQLQRTGLIDVEEFIDSGWNEPEFKNWRIQISDCGWDYLQANKALFASSTSSVDMKKNTVVKVESSDGFYDDVPF